MWLATRGQKEQDEWGIILKGSDFSRTSTILTCYFKPLFIQHEAMSSFQDAKIWPGKEKQGISRWLWAQPQEQSHFKKTKQPPNPIKCYFLKQRAYFIIFSKTD